MDSALILSFETSGACGSVALTRGGLATGKILAEYSLHPEKTHSRRLLGLVEAMMLAAETGWQDLSAIAVSQGPGSFTGLRIGMAAAKGLAVALDLPLIGVPTLDALAEQLPLPIPGLRLCPVLDARKKQVYAACYSHKDQGLAQRESDYLVLEPEALIRHLQESAAQTLIFGSGAPLCAPFCSASAAAKIMTLPQAALQTRAGLIGLCALPRLAKLLKKKENCAETGRSIPLAPLYVRASEAELGQALASNTFP